MCEIKSRNEKCVTMLQKEEKKNTAHAQSGVIISLPFSTKKSKKKRKKKKPFRNILFEKN